MQIFTDASMVFNRLTKKPLFSAHAMVLFDENYEVVDKSAYISTVENILLAEQKTILDAMRNYANYGDIIYTDSEVTVKRPSKKIVRELKQKNLTLKYLPRELNSLADLLCRKVRNEELKKRYARNEQGLPYLQEIKYDEESLTKHFTQLAKNTVFKTELDAKKAELEFNEKSAVKLADEIDVLIKIKRPNITKSTENLFTSFSEEELENIYHSHYVKMVKNKLSLDTFKSEFQKCTWNVEVTREVLQYAVITFVVAVHKRRELSQNTNYFKTYALV